MRSKFLAVSTGALAISLVGWIQPFASADAATAPSTVRVATWNAYSGNSTSGVIKGMKGVFATADVLGLQELSDVSRRAALKKTFVSCGGCDYAAYMPSSATGGKNPIFWKKSKFALLGSGSDKVYSVTNVEAGAGGTRAPAKFVIWVKLRDKASGVDFYVINIHTIPTIERGGRPTDNTKRLALFKRHMSALTGKIDQFRNTGAPVFVVGDFNVDYRADRRVQNPSFPYMQMKAHNTFANWDTLGTPSGGTHGGRLIDYVWQTKDSEANPISQKVLSKYGSDHSPVIVSSQMRKGPAPV